MQNSFDPTITARIAARNQPEQIRARLTLRLSFIYLSAFVAGLMFCRYALSHIPHAVHLLSEHIFTPPFSACHAARDYVRQILISARVEILVLALLVLSGMTLFCEHACHGVLSLHALFFGAECYSAIDRVMHGSAGLPHANLTFFLYFFCQLASVAVLFAAAAEAVIFSCRYRDLVHGLRKEREALSVHYMLCTVSTGGTLAIIAAVRTLMAVMIEKI